jgi:hypothetical protein
VRRRSQIDPGRCSKWVAPERRSLCAGGALPGLTIGCTRRPRSGVCGGSWPPAGRWVARRAAGRRSWHHALRAAAGEPRSVGRPSERLPCTDRDTHGCYCDWPPE